jgi:hyperosmotically inducible protein
MRNSNQLCKGLILSAFVLSLGAAVPALAEGAGQYVDDATITTKVKAAFLADSQLKATQVSVETNHGVVQLSGAVGTKDQEAEAVHTASTVGGVQSVKDLLTVSASAAQ